MNGSLCLIIDTTMAIEQEAHRERIVHWGPRTLDIDILFYDDAIIHTKRLTVPHIEIPKRTFVLEPLAAIAPYYMHTSVLELLQRLEAQED